MSEKKALICEDEALISHWLEKEVASLGYEVAGCAADGQEAVEMVQQVRPDVVLMDIKMPRMSGIEATSRIMQEAPTTIVMLTAYGDETLVQQAIDAGASAYLVKPVSKQQLGPTLRLALARFEEFKHVREQVSSLKETLETRKLVEKAKGLLMERAGLSEQQAYARLRRMSQDKSIPIKDVALDVIHAAELLSGG